MLPAYFCHVPFMKISTSWLFNSMVYSLSILKVTFLKSNPFRFKETNFVQYQIKMAPQERGLNQTLWQSVLREMLIEANQANFWFIFFSILWHKVWVLIYNIFIFEKVGYSKFVEMHGDTSDFFRSASKSDRYFFSLIAIYL